MKSIPVNPSEAIGSIQTVTGKTRLRRFIGSTFFVFTLWTIFFLILAESALRSMNIVSAPMRIPTMLDCDASKLYGWGFARHSPLPILNPDTGEIETVDYTNSQGWKDTEHTHDNTTNAFRILVVGDSMTQGIPTTNQVFHRVLENLFRADRYRVEVIAHGVGGWSTDQEFRAYENEGINYSPNLVISQWCHNDLDGLAGQDGLFADSLKPFTFKVENGDLKFATREREVPKPSFMERLDRSLVLKSRLFYFGQQCYFQYVAPLGQKTRSRNRFLTIPLPDDAGFHSVGEDTPEQKKVWDLYQAIMLRWKEMSEANNSQLVVFTECCERGELEFGLRWAIYKQNGEKFFRKAPAGKWVEVDFKKPARRLDEVCQTIGVDRIPIKRFYERYECDPHPNIKGNRAMAEDIRDYVLSHPILSKNLERFRDEPENRVAVLNHD